MKRLPKLLRVGCLWVATVLVMTPCTCLCGLSPLSFTHWTQWGRTDSIGGIWTAAFMLPAYATLRKVEDGQEALLILVPSVFWGFIVGSALTFWILRKRGRGRRPDGTTSSASLGHGGHGGTEGTETGKDKEMEKKVNP